MYVDRWSPGLRQGDVLGEVFMPAMASEIRFLPQAQRVTSEAQVERPREALIQGAWRFVAVVSHDCEFNEGKREKLLVARIQGLPRNLTSEERVALRESNDVEARSEAGENIAGVNSWLFDPLPGAFDEESVADFTSITALPMGLLDEYRSLKRAELHHDHRLLFRFKLAWFFGRPADDVPDEEKSDRPALDGSGEESGPA